MKKASQLGMNPSTASHRLVKDLLFKFAIQADHKCHQCGGELTRETFSIEHKEPWIDSEDPVRLFFDLENIAFSHLSCNVGARRQTRVAQCGTESGYSSGCRCGDCKKAHCEQVKRNNPPERRRERYAQKKAR